MPKLSPETVGRIMKTWDVIFPGSRTDAELNIISLKFFTKLAPFYSDQAFVVASELVEDEQEFFPTIAHMRKMQLATVDKMNRDSGQLLLPQSVDDLTDEEIALNKKRIKIFLRQCYGKLTQEEADREMKQLLGGNRK